MEQFTKADLQQLIFNREQCCISVYMPTHRSAAHMEQDQIRYKNLLREAEKLTGKTDTLNVHIVEKLAEAWSLLQDQSFWRGTADGLALFFSQNLFSAYRLPFKFDELVVAAHRFHIKPLLPLLNNDGRFFILALSQNHVRLFQASRFSIKRIGLHQVEDGLTETLGYDHESGTQIQFHTGTPGSGRRRAAIFHGHAVDSEEGKEEIRQYFRKINQKIHEILRDETAPLVLAGVDFLLPIYHEVSEYRYLMKEGISGNTETLKGKELLEDAWKIVKPGFIKKQQDEIDRYHSIAGKGLTSRDISPIVSAACHGRIEALFVALEEQYIGSFDRDRDEVIFHDYALNDGEDLLNLAAVETLLHSGTVYALNRDQLPEPDFPAAAILRF